MIRGASKEENERDHHRSFAAFSIDTVARAAPLIDLSGLFRKLSLLRGSRLVNSNYNPDDDYQPAVLQAPVIA